jgi:hypothetical protein
MTDNSPEIIGVGDDPRWWVPLDDYRALGERVADLEAVLTAARPMITDPFSPWHWDALRKAVRHADRNTTGDTT